MHCQSRTRHAAIDRERPDDRRGDARSRDRPPKSGGRCATARRSAAARELRTLADVMTLVTLGDSDVRMVALIDLTVVQGEPRTLAVRVAGWLRVDAASRAARSRPASRADGGLMSDDRRSGGSPSSVPVSLERAARRRIVQPSTPASSPCATCSASAARWRSKASARWNSACHERDRHASHRRARAQSRRCSRWHACRCSSAFRYQRARRRAGRCAFDVKRFADAGVLAAVADRAVATTLVTSEGRALTEVSLHRAEPRAAVPESVAARRRNDGVGGCRPDRPRSRCSATMARACRSCARVPSARHLRSVVRVSACRDAIREERRDRDDPAAHGHAGRHRRMGGVRA